MIDPTYPAFSILSFIGFILVLIPLPWHLQAWNSGTCLFMFWTALGSLNMFINSIIWHNNAIDWAPVWCDICVYPIHAVSQRQDLIHLSFSDANYYWSVGWDSSRVLMHQPKVVPHSVVSDGEHNSRSRSFILILSPSSH